MANLYLKALFEFMKGVKDENGKDVYLKQYATYEDYEGRVFNKIPANERKTEYENWKAELKKEEQGQFKEIFGD